jgi:hypothetical protein
MHNPSLNRKYAAAVISFSALIFCCHVYAADNEQKPDLVSRENASLRFGWERLTLPGQEMIGMMGTTYLVEVTPNIYLGPAAYSSVSGDRGGFYTVGGEVAWRHKLGSRFALETGLYAGGGGGGSSIVGGGLMLRPHADLMWDFGGYRLGVSGSSVRFPNGHIHSNQIGLVADFDMQFLHTSLGTSGQQLAVTERTGVGFDRAYATIGAYRPSKSSTLLSGAPMQGSIGYVGTRMERMITPNLYAGLEAAGANTGGVAGYAEFLGTVGVEAPVLSNNLTVGSRVALGTGGGGSVSVGGGLLVKVGAYATANMSDNFHITLEGGMFDSPNGNFRGTYGTLGLRWDLDHPFSTASTSRLVINEWVSGSQHYFKARRKNGTEQDMDSVTLKLNRYLTDSFYLSGQAHSAYAGHAGGYSVGLIGAGYHSPSSASGIYAGAEMLAGAAGGGSVDTAGGVVMQPLAYVGVDLTKSVSARVSAGRIISTKGELNSNVLEFGLSYKFGTTTRN